MHHRTSPYVRRLRLAAELEGLQKERGKNASEFAKFVGLDRSKLSRLMNGRQRPDLAEVMQILQRCEVDKQTHEELMKIAFDAAQRGWWDSMGDGMGARQQLFSDVEFGAKTIREFQNTTVPGVLQTPEYTWALVQTNRQENPALDYSPEKALEARAQRQRSLFGSNDVEYEVILDEIVTRRLTVPAHILSAQLFYLVELASQTPTLTLRLLPIDSGTTLMPVLKGLFVLYTFFDPKDSPLAIVDTVTSDLVLSDPATVALYAQRYDRIRDVALPADATLVHLTKVAEQLKQEGG